jgi:hypothetical protein
LRVFIIFLFVICRVAANVAVSTDEYEKIDGKSVEIIYAKEHKKVAKSLLEKEERIVKRYTKSFGYELDSRLYLGILSSNNQIPNAYSTQIPLNMQIDFTGGSAKIDYFASKSWIDTLLLHESAHNFQINAKENILSRYTHKIAGNIPFSWILFPIFPLPNLFESSFMIEGNAVLNESLYNNGGRLFNGALKAMVITQNEAGYITPSRTYNDHLFFPYATHHYIVGGYFNLFLSEKFGVDRVNRYFKNSSSAWLPFFTNSNFKKSFGISYEEAIEEFGDYLKVKFDGFTKTKGELIASSKAQIPLNRVKDKIYFLSTDDRSSPTLVTITHDKTLFEKTTLPLGRVYKIKDKLYTLSSAHVTPTKIKTGLFNKNGEIYPPSIGKAVWYIDSNTTVYFDMDNSLDEPKLYKNSLFISMANSSAFVDERGRVYYFRQIGDERVLYRDKERVFSYRGWYGRVADVEDEKIYFIANSKDGSTIYSFEEGIVKREIRGDDIVDMKLSGDKAVVEVMRSEGVEFLRVELDSFEGEPYFEEIEQRSLSDVDTKTPSKLKEYEPLFNLHYSALEHSFVYQDEGGVDFDVRAKFSDPLEQNTFSLFALRNSGEVDVGVGYDNSRYRLNYGVSLYGVLDEDDNHTRDFGAYLYMRYPLYETKYRSIDAKLSYSLTSDKLTKAPLIASIFLKDKRVFGHSYYPNYLNALTISCGVDRGDEAYGGRYSYFREIEGEFYGGVALKYARSGVDSYANERGIEVDSYRNFSDDALSFEMPSLRSDIHLKALFKGSVTLKKVFNFSKYFFSFPVSLRRESLYMTYNYYDAEFIESGNRAFNETIVGIDFDLLYLNSFTTPLRIEYINNSDLKRSNNFRVLFEIGF